MNELNLMGSWSLQIAEIAEKLTNELNFLNEFVYRKQDIDMSILLLINSPGLSPRTSTWTRNRLQRTSQV
jgi:hypothetical protein